MYDKNALKREEKTHKGKIKYFQKTFKSIRHNILLNTIYTKSPKEIMIGQHFEGQFVLYWSGLRLLL